jgi:hypothetical protein
MQKFLVILGLALVAAGAPRPRRGRPPPRRLPGDIHVVKDGYSVSFPIVTCLVISIVVSLILWLFRR